MQFKVEEGEENDDLQKEPVITVDGASGTGKGTVSQLLAKRLRLEISDSGALYGFGLSCTKTWGCF